MILIGDKVFTTTRENKARSNIILIIFTTAHKNKARSKIMEPNRTTTTPITHKEDMEKDQQEQQQEQPREEPLTDVDDAATAGRCRRVMARPRNRIAILLTFLVLVVAVIAIALTQTGDKAKFTPEFVHDLAIGRGGYDPYSSSTGRWATSEGQSGLELKIVNALAKDDKWQSAFATAVQNWEEGYPIDSLTFSVLDVDYDPSGAPAGEQEIKVWNADFGDTGWRGVAVTIMGGDSGEILSADIKMNEYYLNKNNDPAEILYTFCHSLGSSFGLPSWEEEDLADKDVRNCMVGYTENFEDNKTPDAGNFLFLGQLYGGVNVSTGEVVSAEQLLRLNADDSNNTFTSSGATDAPTSTANENHQIRHRRQQKQYQKQRGLSYWARVHHDPSTPALVSRVVAQGNDFNKNRKKMNPRAQKRVVLEVNDHFEVHRLEQEQDDGGSRHYGDFVTFQFYHIV